MTFCVPYYYTVLKYMSAAKENRKQRERPFKKISTILYPFPTNPPQNSRVGDSRAERIFIWCQKFPTDLSGPSAFGYLKQTCVLDASFPYEEVGCN